MMKKDTAKWRTWHLQRQYFISHSASLDFIIGQNQATCIFFVLKKVSLYLKTGNIAILHDVVNGFGYYIKVVFHSISLLSPKASIWNCSFFHFQVLNKQQYYINDIEWQKMFYDIWIWLNWSSLYNSLAES